MVEFLKSNTDRVLFDKGAGISATSVESAIPTQALGGLPQEPGD